MTDLEQRKRNLLDRVEVLLEEAQALPRTRTSWERRMKIEWEILELCRRIASLSSEPAPYWAKDEEDADEESAEKAASSKDSASERGPVPLG